MKITKYSEKSPRVAELIVALYDVSLDSKRDNKSEHKRYYSFVATQ